MYVLIINVLINKLYNKCIHGGNLRFYWFKTILCPIPMVIKIYHKKKKCFSLEDCEI